MTPDRLFELFETERAENVEFRQEMLKSMGELKAEIAVLKAQRGGVAWILVFGVNIASVIMTYLIAK